MPVAIPRACRKQGCAATTTERHGYCLAHQNEGWRVFQRGLSRQARGYGGAWDARRKRVMERDRHLCQACLKKGLATTARTVDHIIPKAHGGTDADGNLQSLCYPCHASKTARERLRRK